MSLNNINCEKFYKILDTPTKNLLVNQLLNCYNGLNEKAKSQFFFNKLHKYLELSIIFYNKLNNENKKIFLKDIDDKSILAKLK